MYILHQSVNAFIHGAIANAIAKSPQSDDFWLFLEKQDGKCSMVIGSDIAKAVCYVCLD